MARTMRASTPIPSSITTPAAEMMRPRLTTTRSSAAAASAGSAYGPAESTASVSQSCIAAKRRSSASIVPPRRSHTHVTTGRRACPRSQVAPIGFIPVGDSALLILCPTVRIASSRIIPGLKSSRRHHRRALPHFQRAGGQGLAKPETLWGVRCGAPRGGSSLPSVTALLRVGPARRSSAAWCRHVFRLKTSSSLVGRSCQSRGYCVTRRNAPALAK
jgi:hypothetical protein